MKLKMIAIAAAVASLTGVAQADIITTGTQDGDLYLYAFDTSTRNWYIRDLGYTINSFLPSTTTTLAGDGSITGDKTPEAGVLIDKISNPANFADASFSAFVSANTAANIRWAVGAIDSLFTGTTALTSTNRTRVIVSSANANETSFNSNVDGYIATGKAGGLGDATNPFTLSKTLNFAASAEFDNGFGYGMDSLATLGQSVSLFYFQRTRGTLGSTEVNTGVNGVRFGNSLNFATVTLEADGDFIYNLNSAEVAAVPLPAAAWMMGAGLIALGGAIRRRKAAAALA